MPSGEHLASSHTISVVNPGTRQYHLLNYQLTAGHSLQYPQILSMVIPRSVNIQRAPDPKSSNPVFDDGMLIKNGEIIFSVVEKKAVGAL
ncbi:hypothetical protein K503DRAFT_805354 [Rhizopogon vinicolor AM-OR11-026]|uniref:DNA-directed RNA polymerase n=1 Tax=Rhizopogon vinicolor AM-OR11-026 TaxID=1314800 RepID=A0A1B7MI47_9AGAM|nr:hypothetical protein K503DRAFT_805354 [Rhizopogon vinicolor AM-OR11-026]